MSIPSSRTETTAVLRKAQPTLRAFLPGVGFGILSAASAVALLAVSAWLITRAAQMPPIMYLNIAIVGVRLFALSRASFKYVERLSAHNAAFEALATVRVWMYERLILLAPDGVRGVRRGDLLARLVADVDQLQDLPLRVIQPLIIALVVSGAAIGFIWMVLPGAALVVAASLLIATLVSLLIQQAISAQTDAVIAPARGASDDAVLEIISTREVLFCFDAMGSTQAAAQLQNKRYLSALQRQESISSLITALIIVITAAVIAGVLWVSAPALMIVPTANETPGLMWGTFTGPYLALIVMIPLAIFEVFQAAAHAWTLFHGVHASAQRVAEAVPEKTPSEIPSDSDEKFEETVGETFESLELEAVSAQWPDSQPVLHGVNLRVVPGDRILIHGPSGCGKTTLAHVLVKFLSYSGSYRINGREVNQISGSRVRHLVGLVEQEPHIFAGTLRQNLLLAQPEATDEDLLRMLETVGLAQWCLDRGGLDSDLGERGNLTSGGQAQRISLARALLHDFPVVILDEPTANVDAEFADQLMGDILRASTQHASAVLVISHIPVDETLLTKTIDLGA